MSLKALFLDMDETLCDTSGANVKALEHLRKLVQLRSSVDFDTHEFARLYLSGIYKDLSDELRVALFPIENEEEFRTDLMKILLRDCGWDFTRDDLHSLRREFDDHRMRVFDFFPGVSSQLKELKKYYKLIVITNGPIYSQRPKVKQLKLRGYVDAVIIGGEEPEEKPHKSIFEKALRLADCAPQEALHVGDSEPADIKGANNAGVRSVWINAGGEQSSLADFSFKSFAELNVDFLKSI